VNILAISKGCGLFNPKSGCSNRFSHLVQQLQTSHNVIVLQSRKFQDLADISITKTYYFRHHIGKMTFSLFTDFNPFFIISMIRILQQHNIDLVQVSSPYGIVCVKFLSKILSKHIRVVYDAYNVESEMWASSYSNGGISAILRRILSRTYIQFIEKKATLYADHVISVGHTDKDTFQRFFNVPENKITVIPSGVDIKPLPAHRTKLEIRRKYALPEDQIVVVFHGSYFHPPNRSAFDQIANYIAPETFKHNPNILFLLIGTGVPHYDGINLLTLGFVEDLHSIFSASDMAIVPLSSGGGTKLKMLDYLGAGLPIISTNKGIEGLNIVPGQHSVIAKDVGSDFVRVILQLANDPEFRRILGKNARKLAEEEYDWKIIGELLNSLYGKNMTGGHI